MSVRMLAVRFRNRVRAIDPGIEFIDLRNVLVNGAKRGCCGYCRNPVNGRMVYVTTDVLAFDAGHEAMARLCRDEHDVDGVNHWTGELMLPELTVRLLHGTREEYR